MRLPYLLFWVSGFAFAQVSFRAQTDYLTPFPRCCAIVSGDFNSDGHIDLIASPIDRPSTPVVATLLFLQNNGDGTFTSKPVRFALTVLIAVVGAADLNGDGKLDLVARDLTTGHGVWLAGHGDGTFDLPVDLGIDTLASVADFRGDKVPDLLADGGEGFNFVVRAGNGKGSFEAPAYQYGGTFFTHVSLGDLNGDGILDVVARMPGHPYSTQLYIGLGRKDGTFAGTILDSPNYAGGIIADVNGDRETDIVQTAINIKSGLAVRQGNGDGTFKDPVVIPSNAGVPYATADFDGDGKLDVIGGTTESVGSLAVGGAQPSALAVSLGINGDLTFRKPIIFGRMSMLSPPPARLEQSGGGRRFKWRW